MKKKRTVPLRSPPEMEVFIKDIQAKKFVEQKRFIPTSRILMGMLNQYKKNPNLVNELYKAKFEDLK